MGAAQSLRTVAMVDGEPPEVRARKAIVVPLYVLLGVFGAFWAIPCLYWAVSLRGVQNFTVLATMLMLAGSLLPAGVHVMVTKRVSQRMCEVPIAVVAVAVMLADFTMVHMGGPTASPLIVLCLDCLLLCDCSDKLAVRILGLSVLWLAVASVLRVEDIGGVLREKTARLSADYCLTAVAFFSSATVVLVMDFRITRGFAKSMREQQAMVQASIQVSELAAVQLSRYETAATKTLLEGPGADGLPDGLRAALLQLVANLAEYRPYLPQSCFRDNGGGVSSDSADAAAERIGFEVRSPRLLRVGGKNSGRSSPVEQSQCTPLSTFSGSGPQIRNSIVADVRRTRVSMVAVNTKGFLTTIDAPTPLPAVSNILNSEVDCFVGEVLVERGVVDQVSGDHMSANFNAVQLCTSHKASSARVAWAVTAAGAMEDGRWKRCPKRTGCACSGIVVVGDFGTSELRRFMMLGPAVNTLHGLERVAAQLGTVLVDETVGADADVGSEFFLVLVERLRYAKRSAKPFLVWQLAGQRDLADGPAEWMYEMERQTPNPHDAWNRRLEEWLHFGEPLSGAELRRVAEATGTAVRPSVAAVAATREQSYLIEATAAGGTVAFCTEPSEITSTVPLTCG